MLRRNPLAAMSLHHPSRQLTDELPPSTLGLPPPDAQLQACRTSYLKNHFAP